MVAAFNSYLTSFVVMLSMLETVLIILFESYSFSLPNIAFEFSFCGLNAILNVSAVTLLAPIIASPSTYLMTYNIASPTVTLDNGVFLQSL